jgi:hypothetical protein
MHCKGAGDRLVWLLMQSLTVWEMLLRSQMVRLQTTIWKHWSTSLWPPQRRGSRQAASCSQTVQRRGGTGGQGVHCIESGHATGAHSRFKRVLPALSVHIWTCATPSAVACCSALFKKSMLSNTPEVFRLTNTSCKTVSTVHSSSKKVASLVESAISEAMGSSSADSARLGRIWKSSAMRLFIVATTLQVQLVLQADYLASLWSCTQAIPADAS